MAYMNISDEQLLQFEEHGFLIVEQILAVAQVQRMLDAMERLRRGVCNRDIRPPAQRKVFTPFGTDSSFLTYFNPRVLDADVWEIATDGVLGCTAARLLRTPSVSLIEDQLL